MAGSSAAVRLFTGMLSPLRRTWWPVVAGAALGLTLGLLLLEQFPVRYRAQMKLPALSDSVAERSNPLETATIDRLARRVGARDRAAIRASLSYLVDEGSGQGVISALAADEARASAIVEQWARLVGEAADGPLDGVTVAPIEAPAAGLFLLLGLAIGLPLFVGPTLVRGAIDPLIWDAEPLRKLEQPLFATIPRISTPAVRSEKKRRLLVNVGLSSVCLAILSLAALTHVS